MKIKLFMLIALTLFFTGCETKEESSNWCCEGSLDILNESMNMPRPGDSYDYPILPCMGVPNYSHVEEVKKACVIPVETVGKMSTQAVIQALWEYPFFEELVSETGNRNLQTDFESMFCDNNAYKELLRRTDVGKSLLQRYKLVDVTPTEYRYHPLALELLFSQPNILCQLSYKEKIELVSIIFEKERKRMECNVVDPSKGKQRVTMMFMGRIMIVADYPPFINAVNNNPSLKKFLDNRDAFLEQRGDFLEFEKIITDNGSKFCHTVLQ